MKKTFKCFLAVAAFLLMAIPSFAQITTANLAGQVLDESGEPLIGAAVVAVHTPSGTQYYAVTNEDGRYAIQGMRTGGPYEVTYSLIGCQTVVVPDIVLSLAETYQQNVTLKTATELLNEAIVVASALSKFSTEKTGAATNISNQQITNLPSVSRAITDVTRLSPYGGNGMSFAGADGRMANFTVDGA
ncbi:MAG: carboxypeptidase regulatory-like domain-containing protein, partial [Bacteroidales bacterium]|nr:carboxypeptidase regulatory-like domain-containing protein [Bacteroidales bacterium]